MYAFIIKTTLFSQFTQVLFAQNVLFQYWCAEKQIETTMKLQQLFGGYGYMTEYPIANLFAGARVQTIYGGTTEIMKELIARTI